MQTKLKRILSFAMVLLMMFGMFPTFEHQAKSVTTSVAYAEEVDELTPDGEFIREKAPGKIANSLDYGTGRFLIHKNTETGARDYQYNTPADAFTFYIDASEESGIYVADYQNSSKMILNPSFRKYDADWYRTYIRAKYDSTWQAIDENRHKTYNNGEQINEQLHDRSDYDDFLIGDYAGSTDTNSVLLMRQSQGYGTLEGAVYSMYYYYTDTSETLTDENGQSVGRDEYAGGPVNFTREQIEAAAQENANKPDNQKVWPGIWVSDAVTDEYGYFNFPSITLGRSYYIIEKSAAPGYELDTTVHFLDFDPKADTRENVTADVPTDVEGKPDNVIKYNEIRADNYTMYTTPFIDEIQRAPFIIAKQDTALQSDTPQGDSRLDRIDAFKDINNDPQMASDNQRTFEIRYVGFENEMNSAGNRNFEILTRAYPNATTVATGEFAYLDTNDVRKTEEELKSSLVDGPWASNRGIDNVSIGSLLSTENNGHNGGILTNGDGNIHNWNETNLVERVSTGVNGIAVTSDLPFGVYQITEIDPPDGYLNGVYNYDAGGTKKWSAIVTNFPGYDAGSKPINHEIIVTETDLTNPNSADVTEKNLRIETSGRAFMYARNTLVAVYDHPERSFLDVRKMDINRDIGFAPQGDATLIGATFTVVNKSRNAVTFNDDQRLNDPNVAWNDTGKRAPDGSWKYDNGDLICTLTTANDEGECPVIEVPFGTYEIRETLAPLGYLDAPEANVRIVSTYLRDVTYSNQFTEDHRNGDVVDDSSSYTEPGYLGNELIQVYYDDSEGAEVTRIRHAIKNDAYLNTSEFAKFIDKYGFNAELTTLSDEEFFAKYHLDYLQQPVTLVVFKNEIQKSRLIIDKWDIETGKDEQGDGVLGDMAVKIINRSDYAIWYCGDDLEIPTAAAGQDQDYINRTPSLWRAVHVDKVVEPGEEVCKMWSGNYNNRTYMVSDLLPYGTYEVVEIVAPYGYTTVEDGYNYWLELDNIADPEWRGTDPWAYPQSRAYPNGKNTEQYVAGPFITTTYVKNGDQKTATMKTVTVYSDRNETVLFYDGVGEEVTVRDPVLRGKLRIQKFDAETGNINQGDATFVGTEFIVYNSSISKDQNNGGPIYMRNDVIEAIEQANLLTDENGNYITDSQGRPIKGIEFGMGTRNAMYNAVDGSQGRFYTTTDPICKVTTFPKDGTICVDIPMLPFGHYEVIETKAPRGYLLDIENGRDDSPHDAFRNTYYIYDNYAQRPTINDMTTATCTDTVKRGKIALMKKDDYTGTGEGSSTLANAEFSVYNRSGSAVLLRGGENPYSKAANYDGFDYEAAQAKHDADQLKRNTGELGKDEGYFIWKDPDYLGQSLYEPDELIEKIYTDENGYAETSMLPYGTYEIVETAGPTGYLIGIGDGNEGAGWSLYVRNFSVTGEETVDPIDIGSDSQYGDIINIQTFELQDSAIRGDVTLQKKDQAQNALPFVVFRVTSVTTGESHILVTDANGEIDTRSGKWPHTYMTNYNDQWVDEEGNVQEDKLDPNTGVWFMGRNDIHIGDIVEDPDDGWSVYAGRAQDEQGNTIITAIDARGALPYDTYHFEELRTSANIDSMGDELKLLDFEVVVEAPAYNNDYGTLADLNPVKVDSELTDNSTGTHYAGAAESVTLSEQLSLHNLEKGREYSIYPSLVDRDTEEVIFSGAPYVFVAEATEADLIIIKMTINASELEGKTIVATDIVTAKNDANEEVVVATHDLKSMRDLSSAFHGSSVMENQSVSFAGISTVLVASDGSKIVPMASDIELVDTVSYSGLDTNTTYEMTAKLVMGGTGDSNIDGKTVVDSNGRPVEATAVFQPTTSSGTVTVTFKHVDLSAVVAPKVVCFERLTLYPSGTVVVRHEDLDDEDQTVRVPELSTQAVNENNLKSVDASEDQMVYDTIAYRGLEPNTTYKVETTLHNAVTHEEIPSRVTEVDGNRVSGNPVFTSSATGNGEFTVTIQVNTTDLEGVTIVVYEVVKKNDASNTVVAEHKDDEDIEQFVYVPDMRTVARSEIGTKEIPVNSSAVIHDTVFYQNLVPGESYKVSGKLYNKATGKVVEGITAERIFVPTSANGQVTIDFTIDATNPDFGGKLVVFETLYELSGDIEKLVGKHENPDDEDQTVIVPSVRTTATDENGDKDVYADGEITIVDTIHYEGLNPGTTYTMKGSLIDKATKLVVIDDGGHTVERQMVFTPETESGDLVMEFTFAKAEFENTEYVVFETLCIGNAEKLGDKVTPIVEHKDLSDEDQTVLIPQIRTTAANDGGDGLKTIEAAPNQKVYDIVKYDGLIVGKSYTMTGKLYNKDTGELLLINGREVTSAPKVFVPTAPNGEVEIEFLFDATGLDNSALVAFETLSVTAGGDIKATHENPEDDDQTVYVPRVKTYAYADEDDLNNKLVKDATDAKVYDTVIFERLVIGETYTIKGTLHDKKTGRTVTDEAGNEYEAELTLTVPAQTDAVATIVGVSDNGKTASGYVTLEFTVDATKLDSGYYVVFERLYDASEKEIAKHEDLTDDDQTFIIPVRLKTTAVNESGNKIIEYNELTDIITIVDTVKMEGLVPGQKYELTGQLMLKQINEYDNSVTPTVLLDVERNPFTQSITFTAAAKNEEHEIKFEVEASYISAKHVVVYEYLTVDGQPIGSHEDIEDEDQTVYIASNMTSHLYDSDMGSSERVMRPDGNTILYDDITLINIEAGTEYTVEGYLVDKETREIAKDANGEEIRVKTLVTNNRDLNTLTFRSRPDNYGEQAIRAKFEFDSTGMEGKTLVAFIRIIDKNGNVFAVGQNLNDEFETVYVPKIRTTLSDANENHEIHAKGIVTLTDKVAYWNLTPGKSYKMNATLMVKNVDANGEIHATILKDKGATVTVPFKPTEQDGIVDVTFTIDASKLEGYTIVAFERLTNEDDRVITTHEDIEDEDQTVYLPKIRTTAVTEDQLKAIAAAPEQTVIDIVKYENLVPGETYTMSGTLYSREDSTVAKMVPVLSNGAPVTASKEFVAGPEGKGEVQLTFKFDATEYLGKRIVAGEILFNAEGEVRGSHENPEDDDQTVYVPEIRTNAKAGDGSDRLQVKDDNATIIDTISYTNLAPGEKYVVKGILMNQTTGEPLVCPSHSHTFTAEKEFTPTSANGTVELEFQLHNSELDEGYVVVYETLYNAVGKIVAKHEDIKDEAQSVYTPADIHTVAASEDGDKELYFLPGDDAITVYDTIEYTGLLPGKTYTATGRLMDKETGNPVLDANGNECVSEPVTFVPTESSGSVVVQIKANGSLIAGKHVVAFEKLTRPDLYVAGKVVTVATHEDLEDEDQTVMISYLIRILKYDGITGRGIPDVTFVVTDRTAAELDGVNDRLAVDKATADSPVDSFDIEKDIDKYSLVVITDEKGYAEIPGIPNHVYAYREWEAADGYELNNEIQYAYCDEEGTAYGDLKFVNLPKGTVRIEKYDAATGEGVPGAEIEIVGSEGVKYPPVEQATGNTTENVDPNVLTNEETAANYRFKVTAVTDENGYAYFLPISGGTYTYREIKAPDGYYVNPDTYTIYVTPSIEEVFIASGNLSFMDAAEGTITITKTTENGNKLAGAQIGFYNATGTKLGSAVTDADGKAYFKTPGPGDYYFIEEVAPKGYMRNENTFKVTITNDRQIQGNTTIVDKADNSPQTSDNSGYNMWKIMTVLNTVIAIATATVLATRLIVLPKKKKSDAQ